MVLRDACAHALEMFGKNHSNALEIQFFHVCEIDVVAQFSCMKRSLFDILRAFYLKPLIESNGLARMSLLFIRMTGD